MKKIIITGLVATGFIIGGTSLVGATNNDNHEPIVKDNVQFVQEINQTEGTNSKLSLKEVREIALSNYDGHIEDIELEHDDGLTYYEVEIEKGNTEYELKIDAYTGEILHVETDGDNDDRNTNTSGNFISAEEAKKIATQKFGGKVVEIELDEDDGRYEYEIELRTSQGEVELTIDAVTGNIFDVEIDD